MQNGLNSRGTLYLSNIELEKGIDIDLQQSHLKYKAHNHGNCSENTNLNQELCIQSSIQCCIS